jgi:ABC-type glycerol-3-phosphate transport system permease component
MSYAAKTNISRVIVYIALIILTLICIVPIWILLVNATRSTQQIQQGVSLLPGVSMIANWNVLMGKKLNVPQGLINSLTISVSVTGLSVYFSLLAAYALEVYEFRLKKILYAVILVLVMIPTQVSIIGFYQYMSVLKLTNTYIPLIIPAIASPGAVFFAKQYLESCVIQELIQAARIDGCSEFSIFNRIMMPIAIPGAFTMAIFAFVGSWNNFFTPFIFISKIKNYTLPMLIQTLRGDTYRTEYGSIYLGLAVSVVPILIVYSIASKYIVNGLAMGAVKE